MIDEYCEHCNQKAGSGCLGKLPACAFLPLATVNQRHGKCRKKRLKTLEKQHMKVMFPYMN